MINTRNIQIKLRAEVPHELEILTHLEKYGTRSGLPKQWLIAGFEAAINVDKKNETVSTNTSKKTHAMSAFVAKG